MLQALVAQLYLVVVGIVLIRVGISEILKLKRTLHDSGKKLFETRVYFTMPEFLLLLVVLTFVFHALSSEK